MGRQTRKWSYKHDKLTQCCRAFTLALAIGFLVTADVCMFYVLISLPVHGAAICQLLIIARQPVGSVIVCLCDCLRS